MGNQHKSIRLLLTSGLAFALLLTLVLSACGSPAPTASTPTPGQPTPAATDVGKKWVFKAACYTPQAGASRPAAMVWWANELEKRTNGRASIDWYWAESLLPAKDILPAVGTGTCDIGETGTSNNPGLMPMLDIMGYPGLMSTAYQGCMAQWDAYQQVPELKQEFAKNNIELLVPHGIESHQLFTTKEIRSLADLKGLKIRSFSGFVPFLKELGAVPVAMTAPDTYTAIQKGTIDGCHWPSENLYKYKIYEVGKYYTVANLGGVSHMNMTMNLGTWNKLPADIQKVFKDLAPEYVELQRQKYAEAGESQLATFKTAGVKFGELSKDEQKQIRNVALALLQSYAKELDGKGMAETKLLNFFRDRIAYYESQGK